MKHLFNFQFILFEISFQVSQGSGCEVLSAKTRTCGIHLSSLQSYATSLLSASRQNHSRKLGDAYPSEVSPQRLPKCLTFSNLLGNVDSCLLIRWCEFQRTDLSDVLKIKFELQRGSPVMTSCKFGRTSSWCVFIMKWPRAKPFRLISFIFEHCALYLRNCMQIWNFSVKKTNKLSVRISLFAIESLDFYFRNGKVVLLYL